MKDRVPVVSFLAEFDKILTGLWYLNIFIIEYVIKCWRGFIEANVLKVKLYC